MNEANKTNVHIKQRKKQNIVEKGVRSVTIYSYILSEIRKFLSYLLMTHSYPTFSFLLKRKMKENNSMWTRSTYLQKTYTAAHWNSRDLGLFAFSRTPIRTQDVANLASRKSSPSLRPCILHPLFWDFSCNFWSFVAWVRWKSGRRWNGS